MAAPAEASGAAVPDPGHDFPLIGALDLPALSGGRRHVVALRPEEIAASVAEPAMAEASETMSVAERVAESLPPREERVRPAPAPVLRAAEVRVSLSELLTLLATGAAAPDEAFAALHLPARQADA
jgi:hypothetical protein